MAKSAGEQYEDVMSLGEALIDELRFKGLRGERAAKKLEKLLDQLEKAWRKVTAKK